MTPARTAVIAITTATAVVGAAVSGYVNDEGWVLKTYKDQVGVPTGCAGVTGAKYGIFPGKTYTQPECEEKTTLAMFDHYFETRKCLPANLPTDTHAAMLRFALNLGAPTACNSSPFAEARAGRLAIACERMNTKPNGRPQWVYIKAGKLPNGEWIYVISPGLVERRKRERAQCERGLGIGAS